MHQIMDYKTNPWDAITAMIGGAICTTWFGQSPQLHQIIDVHFWQYSGEAGLFALKAAAGGLVAIFFKKMGEDLYAFVKRKLFNTKSK